jgi:ketol-acid reductoisomerase
MREMLREIQSGAYADGWIREHQNGLPHFLAARQRERDHQIEQVGARLRAMMPFLDPVDIAERTAVAK